MSDSTTNDPGGTPGPSGRGSGAPPPPPPPPPSLILKPSVLGQKLLVTAASRDSSAETTGVRNAKPTSNKIKPVIPKNVEDYPGFPVKKTGQSGEEFDNEGIEYWRKWRNSKV